MLLDLGASASRTRRLRWPGAASLSAFEGRLRSSLLTWSDAWGLGAVGVQCEPASLVADTEPPHWQALAQSADGETLAWVGSSAPREGERLAVLLFGRQPRAADSAEGSALADGVGEDAWGAWRAAATTALHGMVLPALQPDSAPPASDNRAWSGAVRATVALGSEHWVLHVRAAAVDGQEASAGRAAAPRPALQPLPQALARHRIALRAYLEDVPVTLGELLALQAGDVLLTPHRLAEPLRVRALGLAATASLYAAHLAQRDGRMALLLAPIGATASNDRLEGNRMNTTPPTAQLLGLPEAQDPSAAAPSVAAATNPLLGVKTTLQVCVGEAMLSVGELTQARIGQVLKLDREVDGLVDLMLDGRVVARGQLVAVDDCFGVRLTELPLPLSAGPSTGA